MDSRAVLVVACLAMASLMACSGGSGGGSGNPGGSTPLAITGAAPDSGPVSGGTLLTITGAGFAPGLTVTIGGEPCTGVTILSDTEATCMTPAVAASMVGPQDLVLGLVAARTSRGLGFAYLPPTFDVVSPAQGSTLPNGTVAIDFDVENFVLGDYGQTHLHYYIDGRSVGPYEFLNGATSEVHLNGVHTHFTHWTSTSSIEIFGLPPGNHTVEFVLATANHSEFTLPGATETLDFDLEQPAPGIFRAVPVIGNLPSTPIEMRFTGDGRLLYTDHKTGSIRTIQTATWQLDPTPFYTFAIRDDYQEDGILGLELHPDYAANRLLYTSYVATNGDLRVIRLRDVGGQGTTPTVILDNMPIGSLHPTGKLRFGADDTLYVGVGDASQSNLVQNINTLNGKILRLNPNGSIPGDNPFPGNPVFALGFRNPFGFDVHPDTDDLWLTDNGFTQDDELNLVRAGENFAWDGATDSMGPQNSPCCVDPLWSNGSTQESPTGLAFASANTAYGASFVWNAFHANHNFGEVIRIVPTGMELDELGSRSVAFTGGLGGLVGIVEGPDGFLYVSTSNREIHRLELVP